MKQDNSNRYALVADIGGTNARFARVHLESMLLDSIRIYPCAEFPSLELALMAYRKHYSFEDIKRVSIAIACPVLGDLVSMTNCSWHFSIQELKKQLSLEELKVINDFYSIATSLPVLGQKDLLQIGQGQSDKNKTRVVLGAGTGLGVAYLIPNARGYVAYAGEGGHAGWGATTEKEWFIYHFLNSIYGHVSQERLLSGHGLENLYRAIAAFHQHDTKQINAAEIITLALSAKDPIAEEAVEQFFVSLGIYAGDLALTLSAFGGVYLAGGILPRLVPLIQKSQFRACFEDKGRFRDFNQKIPTYLITAEQPGILGAAVHLKQSLIGDFDVLS